MNRIVLEHVGSIVEVEEGIVDGDGHDIAWMLHCSTAHETSDAAEAVDSEFDSHVGGEFVVVACLGALIWIYEKSEGVSGSFRLAPSRRHWDQFLCVVLFQKIRPLSGPFAD